MAAAHVDECPGLAIGDLAARLEVGSATAGQLVDRMVRGGWVERSPSPNDRRSQIVVPTRKTQKNLARPRSPTSGVEGRHLTGPISR
jgi:DNA-binding MarR family transcriptional regulator